MDAHMLNTIANFIWGIADDCLRDVYVRGKYRDVILPMTVIRRLDAVLEDTKQQVLDMKKMLDGYGVTDQWGALCNTANQAFCNASPFCLRDLTSRPTAQKLKADFEAYLDGFSPNVQEILDKFKFRNQIDTMIEADILGAVIQKFVSKDINLSPKQNGNLPGLDNHAMGTIFEELVRRFNEANNEEAGEHWTPRDVVELMADLVFAPIADQIKDAAYSCYDGACGTGGMLTVAQGRLNMIAEETGKKVSIHLFGQELQPETYAIAKADMMLKGDGEEAMHIAFGSTLSNDQHASRSFDFMLANPPYGKSWKVDAEKMASGKKKEILDSRFNAATEDGEPLAIVMNPKKIRRLMQKYNLFCPIRKANPYRRMAKALKTNHVAENLVDRQFEAHGPRTVLLTDITYIPYNGTFCYLSTIIDAYTKQVLSYVLSESLEVDFVLRIIELLVERHGISLSAETMIHSDQGCHYTSYRFIQIVKDSGLRQSMSRRGNCWDNAPQESFFGHMKDELADERPAWRCFEDVSDSIDRWMDYYNTERYQWQLAKLSPDEFYEFITTGVYPLPCAVPEGYPGGSAP